MFNPRQQAELTTQSFSPLNMLASALNTAAPWESIVDFVTHPSFCDFPIYPKQATLLKLMFLETDNFTAFDVDTIEKWRDGMMLSRDCFGVQPDIWHRIDYLKARGYRRFPHIQMVVGRRAGKGLIGGALGCEQIAYLHSLDNPQLKYGVQEGKDVYMNVGGTSQTMAMRQLFADIRTMVERCKYFRPPGRPPWIAESKDHVFRVRTPADLRRIAELKAAKIPIDHQIASLVAVALSASSVAGRGATSYANFFDEFAFHVQTGSVKSDSQIYKDWQPSLGQFGQDSLTYIPSSPATKIGEFYALYQRALVMMSTYNDNSGRSDEARETLVQNGVTVELDAEPTWLLYQGPSWSLYEQWERTQEILGLGYTFPKAPEPDLSDERQMRERRRDPQKFKVEKQGQFSEVQGAYLDEDKVNKMFMRPHMLDPETGERIYWREALTPQSFGTFDKTYRMHCDPGLTGANFAMCIGHLEDAPPDKYGIVWPHVIIDLLKVWRPMDYPEDPETHKQTIDYVNVHNDLDVTIGKFLTLDRVSFDQWQSASFISSLRKKYSPGIHISEVTFNDKENQARFEKFKSALNLEWVHSYADNFYIDDLSCLLELELKFLSVAPNGKVVKQDIGPVTTKDLCDCLMVVTTDLLSDALDRYSDEQMNARAFGSSNAAALRSGRELDRVAETGASNTRVAEQMAALAAERMRSQLQGRGGRAQTPSRLSSIHARNDRNNRRLR